MGERNLIEQMKNGSHTAFATLYDCYYQRVYNFTRLYVSSAGSIADIVQDVFVRFWEARHLIDSGRSVEGLLFIITRNIIFTQTRSRKIREDLFKMNQPPHIEYPDAYNQEDCMVAENLKENIDRLLVTLPERRREVFRMSREENMSYREIASRCGIGEKAVERHIYLVLKYLKEKLNS